LNTRASWTVQLTPDGTATAIAQRTGPSPSLGFLWFDFALALTNKKIMDNFLLYALVLNNIKWTKSLNFSHL